MELTEAALFSFILLMWIMYYIIPGKFRWICILLASLGFVFVYNPIKSAIYMMLTICIVYLATLGIEKLKKPFSNIVFVAAIFSLLGSMLLLNTLVAYTGITAILAPLGISYYSFSLLGYLIDVERGIIEREKNPLKLMLFSAFAPTLISGPILRYSDIKSSLFNGHRLRVKSIIFGMERILFGLFKKFVISDRIAVIVNVVYNDYDSYTGSYILLAFLLFPIQLYTDFSGCIDIIMGIAELFGVELPENFNLPFLSKTVAEFWRNWHITLGNWLRDYVFYTLLRLKVVNKITKYFKNKGVNRKQTMQAITWIALFITWLCIGAWHKGTLPSIFGVGIFFGIVIILSEASEPFWNMLCKKAHINRESIGYKVFQICRTYALFAAGNSFFRQQNGLLEGFRMWKNMFTTFNPQVLVDGSLLTMGLDAAEWIVLVIAVVIMILIGIIRAKVKVSVREWIDSKNCFVGVCVWSILLIIVVVFGWYGEGYVTQSFIYQQF